MSPVISVRSGITIIDEECLNMPITVNNKGEYISIAQLIRDCHLAAMLDLDLDQAINTTTPPSLALVLPLSNKEM